MLRERLPIPRRAWVRAAVTPALFVWIAVVVPAGMPADVALRPYTQRWKWWIAANFVSWLVAQALFYLVSLILDAFDFAHGNGSPLEAHLVLLAATPLSGRWMLWVTEPGASIATAAAPVQPH